MIGLIIIGDEILSAQIQEKNLKYMLRNLAVSGYKVSEARIISDDLNLIKETILKLSSTYEFVITSGGVGPTHDDLTIDAIAEAFDVPLVVYRNLEDHLKRFFKEKITDDILKMAQLPEGADVIMKEEYEWPVIKMKNCFILPGVPQIFQKKFDHVLQLLPRVEKYYYASVYSIADESEFSDSLRKIDEKYPNVIVGSYPVIDEPEYKTQLTLKSKEKDVLGESFEEVKDFLQSNNWLVKSIEPSFYNPSN